MLPSLRSISTLTVRNSASGAWWSWLVQTVLREEEYFQFLSALSLLQSTVYCIATDMSLLSEADIIAHRDEQARRVTAHIDRMKYEEGRQAYRQLSLEVGALSPQLYMQLICQIFLTHEVVDRGIFYHVQRSPECLHQFRWRIDQKNTTKSLFETTFEKITPGLLQTISVRERPILCMDFDYSAMSEFLYNDKDAPTHLKDAYGINVDARGGINISKLFHKDLAFPDSKSEDGLQAADLVVSGIRRLLRGGFSDPATAARLLGSLMVQNLRPPHPLKLISFANGATVSARVAEVVKALTSAARPLLLTSAR
jgi:hypothetical protein